MLFGVKSWLSLIRIIVVVCSIGFISIQQLQAQINRGGVKKDTTSFNRNLDTLNQQQEDSVEVFELNYKEKYKSIRFTKSQKHFNYQNVDTLFDLEHQFDPVNKAKFRYNNIGMIGSPVYDLLPEYSSRLNFDLGFNQFKPYHINADSIKIFKVNAPYTKLSWRFGSKAQQFFKVMHANRIKEVLQFGLSINRISGEGFYANQKVRNSGFSAYTSYNTKNKKYKLLSTITTQSYVQEQNGGIVEDDIFDKGLNSAGQLVPITRPHQRETELTYLQNTFGRNKGYNIAVNQYYNFGKYFNEVADTDSTFIKRFVPQFRLKHKIAFVRDDNVFEGNGATSFQFYPSELLHDENIYLDSISVNKLVNQLSLIQTGKSANNTGTFNLPFKSVLSLNYEKTKVKRLFADSLNIYADVLNINNTWLALNLTDNLDDEALSCKIDAQYGFGKNNYQTNKYFMNIAVGYQLPEPFGKLAISYTANNYNAAFLYQNYNSNFYQWRNNFEAININTASINYSNPLYKLSISASRINFKNLPYFFYENAADIAIVNLANVR